MKRLRRAQAELCGQLFEALALEVAERRVGLLQLDEVAQRSRTALRTPLSSSITAKPQNGT